MRSPDQPASAAEVRALIDDIVDQDGFDSGPTLFERFWEWLGDALGVGEVSMGAIEAVLWVVFGLLVILALWFVVQLYLAGRRARLQVEEAQAGDQVSPRKRAAQLRAEAREARAAGELRRALRLTLFALVVGLGARGNLRYRDAWTNRELLDRGQPKPDTRAFLLPLVRELEAKDFGRAPVTEADLDRLEGICDERLGPLEGAKG